MSVELTTAFNHAECVPGEYQAELESVLREMHITQVSGAGTYSALEGTKPLVFHIYRERTDAGTDRLIFAKLCGHAHAFTQMYARVLRNLAKTGKLTDASATRVQLFTKAVEDTQDTLASDKSFVGGRT